MSAEGRASDRIVIRRLAPGDRRALEGLVAEMQDFERALDPRLLPGADMAAEYTADMCERCAAHGGVVVVAELEGEVVGFVGLAAAVRNEELDEPPGSYALVTDLSVTRAYRGQGIGRMLLARAEEHARSSGALELRIAVLTDNVGARSLYDSVGFRSYLEVMRKDLTPLDAAHGTDGASRAERARPAGRPDRERSR